MKLEENIKDIKKIFNILNSGWENKSIFEENYIDILKMEISYVYSDKCSAYIRLKPGWIILINKLSNLIGTERADQKMYFTETGQETIPQNLYQLLEQTKGFLEIVESGNSQ